MFLHIKVIGSVWNGCLATAQQHSESHSRNCYTVSDDLQKIWCSAAVIIDDYRIRVQCCTAVSQRGCIDDDDDDGAADEQDSVWCPRAIAKGAYTVIS